MNLTVVGCGDAFGSGGRYNTCFLICEGDKKILVDCGASTLLRLKQLNVSPVDIDAIIITHFHGDHYGGIPFLMISNKFEYNRSKPLVIYGPSGISEKLTLLQDALYPGTSHLFQDLDIRIEEYSQEFKPLLDEIEMRGIPVTHAEPSNPHGIQIRTKDKLFGFSGDTEWDDSLVELASETDLFICECNNLKGDSPGHLGYETILDKMDLLKTKRLLLTHMGQEMLLRPNLELERLYDGMELEF